MVKDDVKVQNTEDTKKGFTFRELDESVKEKELKVLRRKRTLKSLWMYNLSTLAVLMAAITSNNTYDVFLILCGIGIIFAFLLSMGIDSLAIKTLKNGEIYEFDVEIIKLFPYELGTHLTQDNKISLERVYPIIGRDTTSGYEDMCYLKERDYLRARFGDVITLRRKVSKKDLKRRNITIRSKS